MKKIVNESLLAIRVLIVVLLIVCGVVPAAGHGGPHYAKVTVTAAPTGQGKVYMTTDGDYEPESDDWQNSMSATWNCNDGVDDETDSRTYYVHAQATSGNHFVKWSSNSSGTDSKSTDAKYAYSTSASGSSSSPTGNNIYAIFAVNPTYTCTLLTSENGTYKYKYGDSEEVTVASQHSVTTNQNFTFTALPESGYTLYGWYTKSGNTKTYFDYSSTTISSYALPGNISIGVDFIPAGTPIFQIKGANKTYTDLNAAISACGTSTKTIVLINNGTLPAGNYTIPANVTLLIPFDEGFTCYTTTPALTTNTFLTPEVYRTLTMAPGATLTVNGAVSVSAKLSSRSGYGPNGATSGKYGAIKMLTKGNTKSKITLNTGAKLYGWGYIYGEGAVEALSGSTVYEGFVITDWRGGNNTLDMYDNRSTYKVFPFNQYYIQNIEVPLTIHKGATETVYSSVYGNGSDNPLAITMVGESSGLFRLTGTGAKLTKWYDPFYDRQHYELEGAAAINAISFTAFSMTVSSSAFVLPITNNMDITVRQGATVSIAEDICIMPDASVTVEQGATMNIAKNVYVYDIQANTNAGTYTTNRGGYPSAGPGRYAAGAYVRRISYSPSWAALSDRELRRVQNMSSAHFQVNGTLNVNGYLYTTEGGADIFSTTDGAAVNLVTAAGTANKTYQVDHENYDAYYYTIPITSALLHNADGTYQATAGNAANTTWTYANGHWGWCIVWRLEDGTELKRMYQPAQPNATWISSNAPATSKANDGTCSFVFNGWNTVTNTSQQEIILTADYTKTCAEYYDVLWKSEDGTVTYETDANVGKGETTRYNGAAPVKADDQVNGFTYTFDGWTTQPNGGGTKYNIGGTPAATGNATYYAHFTATEVAAIVTANGVVSYYPSIADAFTAANASDYTPTIQVWRDAQNTPALTYTAKNHCTLDLNGHTVSGTSMPLLTINDEGFTFTVTDRTETKEGKLAGTSRVSQAFVVSLVSGVFRLEAGTVYGQNTGTGVMAGVYAGANREVIMTGGTIQVDANSGTGYGIFAQGKGTINGGTIRVESSAKAAYAVQAQGANGNVTVTDGRFYAAGKTTVTCVLANGSAKLTVNGGYYNINTNLTTYLGAGRHIINLPASELPYKYKVGTGGYTVTFQNTDGTVLQSGWWENGATPEYSGDAPAKPGDTGGYYIHSSWTPNLVPVTGDATYTATYVPAPPVASVTISGTTTNYIHFSDAWTAVNAATAASTLTLLQDVTVNTQLTYNNSNNKNCTFDLNGHTLTSNTSEQSPLHINNTNVTFTVTDGTVGKSGKLSLNSSSSSTIFGVYVQYGTFLLNGGTLEVTSSTATTCGVTIHYGTFTMNGGTIHVKTTNSSKEGRGIYANSTTIVNGGTILVEAGGAGYGIKRDSGTATVVDGKFNISGSTANVTTQTSTNANMVIRGGYYSTNSQIYPTAPYYVFALTSGAEFEEGYRYKVAEAYTLTWFTDGDALTGDYTSGLIESGATIVAPATPTREGYTFAGWSPAFTGTMPAVNTTYTATWAVASVTINGTTTLYTTFAPAWTAANSATAASTLTLLQDVTVTTQLTYNNSNNKNCTLDLNGHIISGSATPLLKIAQDGITFTITDLSEEKEGRIECNTHVSGSKWAVEVTKSTLRFEGGTIYAKNTHAGDLFIGIYSGASGVIEMSGGNIHTVTTAANPAFCVLTFGTATISGGSFKVESDAAGYAVEARNANSNVTITGGNFYASGSSTACVHTEGSGASLTLQGGYYNTNTNLAANCATNYHVFPNSDASYPYKVAEGYTVTFKNSDETLQSGLWEKGSTPVYAGETPVKAADAQYTYTFNGWNVPIAPVTANVIYTAQYSSTVNTYTVTWKDADGTTLETDENVPYGATPAYNGATPQKATDAEYAYTFNGWSPAVSAVTGDVTYTATYTTTPVVASVTVNTSGYTLYYTDFDKAFADAKGAALAVTITLLRDASSAVLVYSGANTDCTLDLNGHTLTGTSAQLILNIYKVGSTFTITDKTESKSGQMRIEATNTSEAYGVYVHQGHLRLEAGTIYASLVATTCAGVRVVTANGSFTMDGGMIHVVTTNAKNGIGVTASNGTTVISGGTIQVEAAADGYGIKRDGGTVTVNGGKFNISATGSAYATNQASANASVFIRGGYYTTNSQLNPTAPYHVFGLDNQSPYLYEVAEGYTLTWTTDGDPLTGTYTSGVTKPGTTIVEPTTPTKTGYTFAGWSSAVAETMPAENTEYTATWTPNTNTAYAVKHYQQNIADDDYTLIDTDNLTGTTGAATEAVTKSYTGFTAQSFSQSTIAPDGSTAVSIYYNRDKFTITWKNADGTTLKTDANVKYGTLPVYEGATPVKATDAEYAYTFDTWSPTVSAVTGDVTYTATYTTTPVVASVTINSTTAYYTSFADAWTAANSATAASTLTLLLDVTFTAQLAYTNSNNQNCTFDLNGHTLTSNTSQRYPLHINNKKVTFTIIDGTEGKSGKLSLNTSSSSTIFGVYVEYGTLLLNAGTIEVTSSTATTCGVTANSNGTFTMNGGTIHVKTTNGKEGRGVYFAGRATINGGTVHVEAAGTAYGIRRENNINSSTITVNDGKFNVIGSTAYATNQTSANASVVIHGGYYTTNSQLYPTAPYHVFGLDNQSPYLYEVAEGYTLTWTTDGDPLTGAYTSGVMKLGATITAPATPTKTGYTFSAWSPAVAETMPAENTEYTATWTANQYTITFDSNGGSEVASITQDYGSAVTAPADPFRLGYNFTGWTPAVPSTMPIDGVTCTAQWEIIPYDISYTLDGGTESSSNPTTYNVETATFTLSNPTKEGYTFLGWTGSNGSTPKTAVSIESGSTGDKNYTANWAVNVASVTVNGATTYYTTIDATFTAANASATYEPTITLLQDAVTTTTSMLSYTGAKNCTLDLNGHTLSSTTANALLYINKAGITFTITDLTETQSGSLHLESTGTANRWCVYVANGNLQMDAGTVFLHSKANQFNEGIRIDPAASTFTMNGGKVHVVTSNGKPACGIVSRGIAVINGGAIQVEASGAGYGIEARVSGTDIGNVTVNGGKFLVTGTTAACAYKSAANATLKLQGGYYNTNTGLATYTSSPYAVHATTAEDKASVGAAYNYKIIEEPETGSLLDIIDWTATTLTINANGWTASGWPYTINGVEYESSARAADRTLTIPYSGEPGAELRIKLQDKDDNVISLRNYKIPFIGTISGTDESSIVYVNSGTLTISTNTTLAALIIRPEAQVAITGGTLSVGRLVLRTLPWQAAAINGSFTATETWYTRIAPNNRTITGPYAPITYESARYYQFALPLNTTVPVKDIQVSHGVTTTYGKAWLLKRYDEASRAASGAGDNWVALGENEYIQGGVGYEMSSNSAYYREYYFPVGAVSSTSLGTTTAVSYDLDSAGVDHAGWNIVASPLMGVYDNSGANPETGMKVSWLMTDGSYDQGIPDAIYPAIPFSYQASANQSYISFAGSSIVAAAPRRVVAAEDETERIQWIEVDVRNANGIGDHTSILAHPTRYEKTYKTGIDVAKQSFTASRAIVYSTHIYGEMAFAGVADSLLKQGVALTVYSPTEQELTFSIRENDWMDRLEYVFLVDTEELTYTDLMVEDYHITLPAGTTAGRFFIQGLFFSPRITTDLQDEEMINDGVTKPRKVVINQRIYILVGERMYDTMGRLVTGK